MNLYNTMTFQDIPAYWIYILIGFILGFFCGWAVVFAFKRKRSKTARELAEELFRENEALRNESVDAVIERLKESFGSLSLDVLSKSTDTFLKLAKEKFESERKVSVQDLETQKGLIDLQLQRMTLIMIGSLKPFGVFFELFWMPKNQKTC